MKRRIALISEHASPLAALGGVDSGGQNVYVGELARHLAMSDFIVDVFTRWDNSALPAVVSWCPNVKIIHVKAGPVDMIEKEKIFPFMDEFADNMIAYITKEKISYGLIHANFWMSAMVAAAIKKKLGIPFVVTFHALGEIRKIYQGDNDKFPKERVTIENGIVREADQIVAECPQDRSDLIRYYEASPEKITTIPCGINPNEFYPIDKTVARMVLGLDQQERLILQLGRIVPRKGIDNVIRALSRVRQTSKQVKLMIVGGDSDIENDSTNPEIRRLKTIATEEDVSEAVIFAGRKNREVLKYYYAAADIFVTTPWYEPFGITPLEAMACGTPVIGADVGGIKHSVENGKTGFLVPANDPDALAMRIDELLTDAALLEKFKHNAIKRVYSMFTWSKVAQMMSSLYERVLPLNPLIKDQEVASLSTVEQGFDQLVETVRKTKETLSISILKAGLMLAKSFRAGNKVLICGNGGSAAESQHLAAELVGRFEIADRQGLPAMSLTSDAATLTAWSNDVSFDDIFARQVHSFGKPGDILFCFSTSGLSTNVINAMKAALEKDMCCIALTGKEGGEMGLYAHVNLIIPSDNTQRIQELHLHVLHAICTIVEKDLFGNISRRRTDVHRKPANRTTKEFHLVNGHQK